MKSDYKGLLAIVLSMGVLLVWYTWIAPTGQAPPKSAETPTTIAKTNTEAATPTSATFNGVRPAGVRPAVTNDPQGVLSEKATTIETEKVSATFSNVGGVPTHWALRKYLHRVDGADTPIDIVGESVNAMTTAPLQVDFQSANFSWPAMPRYQLTQSDKNTVVFTWRSKELEVIKTFSLDPEGYGAQVMLSVKNLTNKSLTATPVWHWQREIPETSPKRGLFGFLKGPPDQWHPVYLLNGKVVRQARITTTAQGSTKGEAEQNKVYWAGAESRYFLAALVPQDEEDRQLQWGVNLKEGERNFYTALETQPIVVPAGGTWKYPMTLYAGPKEIDGLKKVGFRLDEAIDYGWFGLFAIPILHLLKFFYQILHNYGVAIILLTVLIKLLLYPINKKSMASMKAMQTLQPKLKELREKYANDKERINVETMNLFKLHKVNPMGGCLPMLAQFPIYIALYKVLWNAVELYQAPFFSFYHDLAAPDPYLVSPILLGIAMVLQQKLTPQTSIDPAQQKMMMMPLMFAGFMIFLPAGLTIYILVNTAMTIAQQWMSNKGIRLRDVVTGRAFARQ